MMAAANITDRLKTAPRFLAVGAVAIYRAAVSPVIHAINGPACRFEPSCSVYARDAIAEYGIIRGGIMAIWRIARCNPIGGHGFDPVRSSSLAPRGERVRVRDDCAAQLSVAPYILKSRNVWSLTRHSKTSVGGASPTGGEAISPEGHWPEIRN